MIIKFMLGLFLFTSIFNLKSVYANESNEDKTKIREVREWMESVPKESTCADEYFQRRKQLGIKMGLEPLIIVGVTASGAFIGGFVGYQLYFLSGAAAAGGFGDLAAMLSGALIGGGAGLITSGTDSVFTIVNFFRNQNLLRLTYESRHDGGMALDGFFEEYQEMYPESLVSKEEFQSTFNELDESGKLCNGSLVDPRRFKKGKRLKQRLATRNEIFKFVAESTGSQSLAQN